MLTVKLNENWTATIENELITITSKITRIEMGTNPLVENDYIRIQAARIGSTIGEIKTVNSPPMAPFILVEIKE